MWWNADDGFDLISTYSPATIEHSWAWHNGYVPGTTTPSGNGAGFKAGGYAGDYDAGAVKHTVRFSVAFLNKAAGFYANHHPVANDFFNNTGYENHPNFNLLGVDSSGAAIGGEQHTDRQGTDVGLPFSGSAPDLGAFEHSGGTTGGGLKDLVADYRTRARAEYTADSWAPFAEALTDAKTAAGDPSAPRSASRGGEDGVDERRRRAGGHRRGHVPDHHQRRLLERHARPQFHSVSQWQFNATTREWRVGQANKSRFALRIGAAESYIPASSGWTRRELADIPVDTPHLEAA